MFYEACLDLENNRDRRSQVIQIWSKGESELQR